MAVVQREDKLLEEPARVRLRQPLPALIRFKCMAMYEQGRNSHACASDGGRCLRRGDVVKEAPAARIFHHNPEVRVGQHAPATHKGHAVHLTAWRDLQPSCLARVLNRSPCKRATASGRGGIDANTPLEIDDLRTQQPRSLVPNRPQNSLLSLTRALALAC